MSAVVDFIEDELGINLGALGDIVRDVWDEVAMPILEEAFAVIGIEAETVINAERVSSLVYGDNTDDVVKAAIIKAVLNKVTTNTDYWPNYQFQIFRTKNNLTQYYRTMERGIYPYTASLEISGSEVDNAAVQTALDTEVGGSNTIIDLATRYPLAEDYIKEQLQASPYFYDHPTNTLTFTDPWGVSRTDWTIKSIVYNSGPDDYTVNINIFLPTAEFWIKGPASVTEGETAKYKIYCNREVPTGESVDINFVYSGTAVDGTDFTSVASVTMLANTQEIDLDIVTLETANAGTSLTVTIDSITNTNNAFDAVAIWTENAVTTSILDDDSLVLTLNDVFVAEDAVNVVVPVKLEQAATGAFTVDYTFTDISTVGGTDYDNTTGTLNFLGNAGEIQNITVPITADVADDDFEQFQIGLTNCSDGTIDITRVAIVTIIDGTNDQPPPADEEYLDTITQPSYTAVRSLVVKYYTPPDTAADFKFWYYDLASGTYPAIDPDSSIITDMEMLPIVVLRQEGVSTNSNPSSNLYLKSRLIMQRLGLDIEEFIDAIEDNPDINSIDDAFLNFAVSPATTDPLVSRVLWESWYEIVVTNSLVSDTGQFRAIWTDRDVNNITGWIEHVYTVGNTGVVATVGEHTHTTVASSETTTQDPSGNDVVTEVPSELIIQFQATATEYDEIKITGIYQASTIATGGIHKVASIPIEDSNFTVPVSWFILETLDEKEQMRLYQNMCRLDIYAIQVTELEFYETAAFFNLLQFALVVISVATGGLTGFVIGSLTAAFIGEIVIIIAELTGNEELAAIIGVVATIALSPGGLSSFDFTSAEALINASQEFSNNMALIENDQMQEMAKDIEEMNEKAKENLENAPESYETPIDIGFLRAVQSVDTRIYTAIDMQYNFDELYTGSYDKLVGRFHEDRLRLGVT